MKKKICISLMAAFAVLLTVSAYFLIGGKVDDNTQAEKYESIAEIVAQPDETAEPVQLTEDKTLLPDYSELYFQNTKNMVAEMNTLVDSYTNENAKKDVIQPAHSGIGEICIYGFIAFLHARSYLCITQS